MHCPIPLPFCHEEQLQLSFSFSSPSSFVWKQKRSNEFEHSISLFGLSTLILYSGTKCVCVWTFWKITGAFLTLADLYFAVSAVRLLIKLFTICCDSHFWEDFSVEPDFVKALLYWPFWYMPVAVTIWIIKPVVDERLTSAWVRCAAEVREGSRITDIFAEIRLILHPASVCRTDQVSPGKCTSSRHYSTEDKQKNSLQLRIECFFCKFEVFLDVTCFLSFYSSPLMRLLTIFLLLRAVKFTHSVISLK